VTDRLRAWAPAILLTLGAGITLFGVAGQRALPLRADLAETLPRELPGYTSTDRELSADELAVVGVTSYLMRLYQPVDSGAPAFSVFVAYYDRQTQGRTIHSPRNCLPGAGWEPLTSQVELLDTELGSVPINRYLLQNGDLQALALYWYQGRGRVEANEYVVKWDLLRDAALRRRSDEALVRVLVAVDGTQDSAFALAARAARALVPALQRALPS
jgi:EpsI family protein